MCAYVVARQPSEDGGDGGVKSHANKEINKNGDGRQEEARCKSRAAGKGWERGRSSKVTVDRGAGEWQLCILCGAVARF